MKRMIRNILFLIIGLLIGGNITIAKADTVDAPTKYYVINSSNGLFDTPDPACKSANATLKFTGTWSTSNQYCYTSTNVQATGYPVTRSFTCPSGSTPTSTTNTPHTCTFTVACVAPQIRNPSTYACENPAPTCTAGTSNSYSNTNLTVKAMMPESVCIESCTYNFSGKTSVGAGEFAQTYGSVGGATGASCTASSVSTAQQAEKDCIEQGKSFITASGTTTCVSPGTPNSPPITNKSNATSSSTNSSGTTTSNTTTNTTVNNNQVTVTNTTITTNPDGSTSTATNGTTQSLNSYCQSNPSASICTTGSFSDGTTGSNTQSCTGCATEATATAIKDKLTVDGSGSGDAAAGYPSVPDSFYTATYQNGLQGVWGDFKAQVNSTQFVSGINGFVPSGWDSGTAPSWNIDFSGLHAGWGSIEVSPASNIWLFIKIVFVVTTLFLCRTIIFGG